MTGDVLEIVSTGPGLLVEDLGRPGWAHLGVPPSGALDRDSLRLANRLVGNDDGDAGLEALLGGVVLTASRSVRVAVTGADASVDVDGRERAWGEPVSVPAGSRLAVGRVRAGLRVWVAVDGGIAVRPTLGSASTDTLTGLGPPMVAAGDRLPLGPRRSKHGHGAAVRRAAPEGRETELRVLLGPRDDWLTPDSLRSLTSEPYTVQPDSDRVGVRLDAGDGVRLERARGGELASEGIVTGAVQATPDGRALVFLADHPVTGGYPVVAVVDPADLAVCAQLRPGDVVRLRSVARRRAL